MERTPSRICRFEALAISLTPCLRAVIAAWLNASERSRDGVGMNRSARG